MIPAWTLRIVALGLLAACRGDGSPAADPPTPGETAATSDTGSTPPGPTGLGTTSPTGAPTTSADTGEPPPFELAEIQWTDCGEGTTCADVQVPADHDDPSGPTLTVHLRRSKGLPARRTLWLVDGGPGDPGTRLVPVITFFQDVFPDLTIIAADHRGTGGSTPLACPSTAPDGTIGDGEWAACAAEADTQLPLAWFTAEAAARDLALLVPAASDGDAVVWGISYGTHVVQRLLAMQPAGVEGAILDGLVPPDWTFADFDGHMDEVGRDYLALCDGDAACAARLGGDAVAFVEAALAGPTCGAVDATGLRALLGALLLQGDDRAGLPAVAYRYARCSSGDEAALAHLVGTFEGVEDDQNELVLVNIGTHELWPVAGAPSATQAAAALDATVVATGAGAWMAARAEDWPRHDVVALDPSAASAVQVPVLLLHGGLDPTAPLHATAALRGAYPEGQAVVPPGAGHVALNFSDCAADAYVQFLASPGAPVSSCESEPFSESFDLSAAASLRLFGEEDPWGDP